MRAKISMNRNKKINCVLLTASVIIGGFLLRYPIQVPYGENLISEAISKQMLKPSHAIITEKVSKKTQQLEIFYRNDESRLIGKYQASRTLLPMVVENSLKDSTLVPGLRGTKSLNSMTLKEMVSGGLVPQGIAVSKDKIYISSYDGNYEVNSVIYVLDRATMKYEKTIIMHGQPHVGGIAYDSDHQCLWVCGYGHRQATIIKISENKLNQNLSKSPIQYDSITYLPQLKRASQVTYNDNKLFVGYFSNAKTGKMLTYKIQNNGEMPGKKLYQNQKYGLVQVNARAITTQVIPTQIQGMTFYHGKLLMSQSFGHKASRLFIYDYQKNLREYNTKNALQIIKMPPMMEQITAENDLLYAVHESGGRRYRLRYGLGVDRILEYQLNQLIENDGEKR